MTAMRSIISWVWVFTVLLIIGCATGNESKDKDTSFPPLRIGISANYVPVLFKENGVYKGIEADLARRLGKELDRPIVFKEILFKELIPSLEAGQIDIIMAGMSVTEDRKKRVSFARSYLRVAQMALIRKSDEKKLATPLALFNTRLRVGFVKNTTGEMFVLQHLTSASHVPFGVSALGIKGLKSEEIDIFIHDSTLIRHMVAKYHEKGLMVPDWPLTEEHLAWAVRKSDVVLLRQLNTTLSSWKLDGFLKSVLKHWLSPL